MKKVPLYPVRQKNQLFYAAVMDPRNVAAVIHRSKEAESQESQRPWIKRKVKEIAKYVAGYMNFGTRSHHVLGLLPNSPIVCLNPPFTFCRDTATDTHYVMFPETKEETEKYKNSVEVIDGQHRILAFADDLRDPDFTDGTSYEMIFSVFPPLSMEEKREIFMITNEKQTKVETNLLRLLKKQLKLLDEEEALFDFVCRMNSDDYSPLKGRIMIGSEQIHKGYKEGQLSKALDKSGTYKRLELQAKNKDAARMAKGLSFYLNAWESVYKVSFKNPGKDTLTKISGLRYVLFLFPDIMEILTIQNKSATKEEFEGVIRAFPKAVNVPNIFTDPETSLAFRGEGATVKLAKSHGKQLIRYFQAQTTTVNPGDAW